MIGTGVLSRIRTQGQRFFYEFGLHCATHQIRIILVSCVVITSLFYPALAMYASKYSLSLSDSTAQILDSFLSTSPIALTHTPRDLHDIWTSHSPIQVREDALSRINCGNDRTLRVEKILVQSPLSEESLNYHILTSTLGLERRINSLISSRGLNCLRRSDGSCFVASPLAYWDYNIDSMIQDDDVMDTLLSTRNVSVAGITVTPQMVLAGRVLSESSEDKYESARYLVLSYFFPEEDCVRNNEHLAWINLVTEAAGPSARIITVVQPPTLLALQYSAERLIVGMSGLSIFLYTCYLGFFAYVTWFMRRIGAVHSRLGLTFTALVEISVSTITSLSVCALVGFKVTMVPWELLPIVIVFVGAENMFSLVDAVVKTSITLNVKTRIAEGLSRAGTSNTLKVVSYNAILGTLAVFFSGAIRQFCVFAIVVLVAHWFLAHTFFCAVLAIDLQRLELDELLRQNASLAPSAGIPSSRTLASQSQSKWKRYILTSKRSLQGRMTKNISLLILLAITATLYYITVPHPRQTKTDSSGPAWGALSRIRTPGPATQETSSAVALWSLLSADSDDLIHVRMEMPTTVVFSSHNWTSTDGVHRPVRSRLSMRGLTPVINMFKYVVGPITVTTTLLYGLLLYLLKDAELLEAQRHKLDSDSPEAREEISLEGVASFQALPRGFSCDVDLISSSDDGTIVAAVSVHDEVVIWRKLGKGYVSQMIDPKQFLLRAASTSSATSVITAITLSHSGLLCAMGTGTGIIGIYNLRGSTPELKHVLSTGASTTVQQLHLYDDEGSKDALLALFDGGGVLKWTFAPQLDVTTISAPGMQFVPRLIANSRGKENLLLLTLSRPDGSLEVVDLNGSASNCVIQPGRPEDNVTKVTGCYIDVGKKRQVILAAATFEGIVSLWDVLTGEFIYNFNINFDDAYGEIGDLFITPIPLHACRYCGSTPTDSFCVSFSIGNLVLVHEATIPTSNRGCACIQSQPRKTLTRESIFTRRPRTASASSLTSPTSRQGSPSLPTREISDFPISAHGVHSRRASEKDPTRRPPIEGLYPLEEREYLSNVALKENHPPSAPSPLSLWKDMSVHRVAEVVCERGCWGVSEHFILGVRRRLRSSPSKAKKPHELTSTASNGLTPASLDKWELWKFDPLSMRIRSSALGVLQQGPVIVDSTQDNKDKMSDKMVIAASPLPPRLPFTRVRPFSGGKRFGFAGFGNTLGLFSLKIASL